MADLGRFRGLTGIHLEDAGGKRGYTVSIDNVVPSAAPSDRTNWEGSPGQSFTLRFEWDTNDTPLFGQADTVTIKTIGTDGTNIGTTWSPTISGNSGSELRTFHFDDNPLNEVAGSDRAGIIRVKLEIERQATVAWGPVDSFSGGTPPSATTLDGFQGYYRSKVTIASGNASNVAYQGATPSTWSYPDDIFADVRLGCVLWNGTQDIILEVTDGVESGRGAVVGSRSDTFNNPITTIYQSTWSGPAEQVNDDFTLTPSDYDLFIRSDNVWNNSDKIIEFATSGHAAGWSRSAQGEAVYRDAMNVDASVSLQSPTRTSAEPIVNYGLHGVDFTFEIHNSRGEKLTSAHGTDARVDVYSYDIPTTSQETVIQSNITPSAAGLYTVSTFQYTGSTSTGNRDWQGGGGPRADHTAGGRQKGIDPVLDTANAPQTGASGALVNLTSLLYLDVHPQQSSTLNTDTNPLTDPGDGESVSFPIAAVLYRQWGYVEDITGAPVNGVTVRLGVYKPDADALPAEGDTTKVTDGTGYTSGYYEMAPVAPAGNWRGRSVVDVDYSGSLGNYGDEPEGNTGIHVPGSLVQAIGFNSPYTADRSLSLLAPDETPIGEQIDLLLQYIRNDGTRLDFDAAPDLRVYKIDTTTGAETDELALGVTTEIGSSMVYKRSWTPSEAGNFIIEVRGAYAEAGLQGSWAITVRPRYDAVYGDLGLVNRM